jgi:pilus assembly protein CpaF
MSIQHPTGGSYALLRDFIHRRLLEVLDLSRLGDLSDPALRREVRLVVERIVDTQNPLLHRMERERLIDDVLTMVLPHPPKEPPEDEPGEQSGRQNG